MQYRVKAYDAAGAESAYTTSATRTVTNNRPPVISGTDGALGSFSTAAPSYEYTVTDADGHQVDVVEMLDGVTLRSYSDPSPATMAASLPTPPGSNEAPAARAPAPRSTTATPTGRASADPMKTRTASYVGTCRRAPT